MTLKEDDGPTSCRDLCWGFFPQSRHAAGRRALGASEAAVGTAVLGRGGVAGNGLSLGSREGATWRNVMEK